MWKKLSIALTVVAIITTNAVAQQRTVDPPEPLPPSVEQAEAAWSLEDLEQMALTCNPSIARAQALVSAARGNWVQVGLPPNPTVGYEAQQIGSRGLAEQDGVFVGQEIVRGGKLRLNREVASQEVSRAQQELATQQQRVVTDVRIAYYEVLIAERQVRITSDLHRVAKEGLSAAESLFKGQEVGKIDVSQAELEYETAAIAVENAKNRRTAAWQGLLTIVGQPRLEPIPLAGEPDEKRPEFTFEAVRDRVLSSSPELSTAVANMERARWAAERARVEATPNVSVQGLVNWRDNGIGGGSDGSLTVGIPLPAWNRNQGGIQQSVAQAVAAERALEQLELDLENRLAPVYERYANARNQAQRYQQRILPAAQEILELTRRSYSAGETGYISLLTAQRTYAQTHLSYLEALRSLRTSEAEIEGLLLSGSLTQR